MTATSPSKPENSPLNVTDNPLVTDVNEVHAERLSATERLCRKIADTTGAPGALMAAIVVQILWLIVGSITHWDPFPFVFLLTCSNVIQLVLIFVIAVAQRQQTMHDEIRAEADHETLSRLLYHQQFQNELLLRLAERTGVDVADLKAAALTLSASAA